MLDAAIGSGANLFITIAILGIALVKGIAIVDILKANKASKAENPED